MTVTIPTFFTFFVRRFLKETDNNLKSKEPSWQKLTITSNQKSTTAYQMSPICCTCDVIHMFVWHDAFTCDVTQMNAHSFASHMNASCHTNESAFISSHMKGHSFDPCHATKWRMNTHVWRNKCPCVTKWMPIYANECPFIRVTSRLFTSDMTHS